MSTSDTSCAQPQNARQLLKPDSRAVRVCSERQLPSEMGALSLFELGLSCWQICLRRIRQGGLLNRGERRAGTMYRAPTGKDQSTLEIKVESRRAGGRSSVRRDAKERCRAEARRYRGAEGIVMKNNFRGGSDRWRIVGGRGASRRSRRFCRRRMWRLWRMS